MPALPTKSIASSSFDQHAETITQPRAACGQKVSDSAAGGVAVVCRRIDFKLPTCPACFRILL
jgi:hypothetical protein